MKRFWQVIKNPLITAGFVLLGLFLYSNFSYILPFGMGRPAITDRSALFTADGTAEATYVPDTALLYLGVNKTAATQEEAKEEANKIINQITADLKKLGVEEKNIKTTNFSVNENYDFGVTYGTEPAVAEDKMMIMPVPPSRTKTKGYVANVNLEVRVTPLEKAEQAIDAATKAGATQIGTSQLVLDETKQKELENKTRIEAIKNAKEKAKEISKAAGIHLGRVVSVQENGGGYAMPYARTMELKMDSAGSAPMPETTINPGENKISVTVTLAFETY
jgi:uncharacterized protein